MISFFLRSKKRGSIATKSAIALAVIATFVLLPTLLGLNFLQTGSNPLQVSPNALTTTKTITKTTIDTTFVCCQTRTSTVTSTTTAPGTITTLTRAPQITGTDSYTSATTNINQFSWYVFTSLVDCAVTISIGTTNVASDPPAIVLLGWNSVDTSGLGVVTIAGGSLYDAHAYATTVSANSVYIALLQMPASPRYTVYISYSLTAICPS